MKTPPLTWIRAFCEAGRQHSFKKAAAELNLSPSTVSHEIRKLEGWVGKPLFNRTRQQTELTEEGVRLFASVQPAFDLLENAFKQATADKQSSVRVGMLPFFANELVLPSIDSFSAVINNTSLELSSNIHLSALDEIESSQRLDAVVRYSTTPPEGYESLALTNITLALVTGGKIESTANDELVRKVELRGNFDAWERLVDAGFDLPDTHNNPIVVDNYLSAMRAIEQGAGVGIAVLPLCESWLTQGRLHLLTDQVCDLPERYWLVWRKLSPKSKSLVALAQSMANEFAKCDARVSALLSRAPMKKPG